MFLAGKTGFCQARHIPATFLHHSLDASFLISFNNKVKFGFIGIVIDLSLFAILIRTVIALLTGSTAFLVIFLETSTH